MWKARQGIHDFLRAYFYFKSADWKQDRPFKLPAFTATELAKMPSYYIMDLRGWRKQQPSKCHLRRRLLRADVH